MVVGRGGIAFGLALIGAGLIAGVVIGRASVGGSHDKLAIEPIGSTRALDHLTDMTPAALPLVEETQSGVPAPTDQGLASVAAPTEASPPAASPPVAAAAAAPLATPKVSPPAPAAPDPVPPPTITTPVAPPPDPSASRNRVVNPESITGSSFDQEDMTESHPVTDHDVTRSAWDDEDNVPSRAITYSRFDDEDATDNHPTGP
ncbi:MAG: hypothetical protein QOI66_2606 [Myxococcales bacterium]|jgi:hypothetical protein|nr:hypothetical protein [Myxococcales bacterium]